MGTFVTADVFATRCSLQKFMEGVQPSQQPLAPVIRRVSCRHPVLITRCKWHHSFPCCRVLQWTEFCVTVCGVMTRVLCLANQSHKVGTHTIDFQSKLCRWFLMHINRPSVGAWSCQVVAPWCKWIIMLNVHACGTHLWCLNYHISCDRVDIDKVGRSPPSWTQLTGVVCPWVFCPPYEKRRCGSIEIATNNTVEIDRMGCVCIIINIQCIYHVHARI